MKLQSSSTRSRKAPRLCSLSRSLSALKHRASLPKLSSPTLFVRLTLWPSSAHTRQTRQKFKEAYDLYSAATIERAEKQLVLAKQARRLLNLLDDTPIVPGDSHAAFDGVETARHVLNDAEDELRAWQARLDPIHSNARGLGAGAMPGGQPLATGSAGSAAETGHDPELHNVHSAYREKPSQSGSGSEAQRVASGASIESNVGTEVQSPSPLSA